MMSSQHNYSWVNQGMPFDLGTFGIFGLTIFIILIILIVVLKGFALWYSAKRNEKWWFIILLVVNTLGILELIYLLSVAKIWPGHTRSDSSGNIEPSEK